MPRQPDSPGLNASGSQAPTPHPALGGRARPSRSRGPESDSPSVQAPRDEQCGGPRGSEREGGGTAGSRGRGACGSGTGTRGLYRRLRAPQQPFRTAPAPPLLFPAAAEAAAAEEAAARPAPPPPAGAIPRRLVGGRAGGGAAEGKAARWPGGCGPCLSPLAPTPRSWLGFSRDSESLGPHLLRFSGTWLLIHPPPRGK